jgi:hypothetical protein
VLFGTVVGLVTWGFVWIFVEHHSVSLGDRYIEWFCWNPININYALFEENDCTTRKLRTGASSIHSSKVEPPGFSSIWRNRRSDVCIKYMLIEYVWLPRKTRRKPLGLVLSYEQKQYFFSNFFRYGSIGGGLVVIRWSRPLASLWSKISQILHLFLILICNFTQKMQLQKVASPPPFNMLYIGFRYRYYHNLNCAFILNA